jgi:hypothetical protein
VSTGYRCRLALVAATTLFGCAATQSVPGVEVTRNTHSAIEFEFSGPNNAALTSGETRGRVTLIALLTTYDLASQLLARRLEELQHTHVPRLNVGAVAMETPRYEVLVGMFSGTVGLSFPVVMADPASLAGEGPFGKVERIPTLVVLDAAGRLVQRISGAPEPARIRAAVAEAEKSR